MQRKDFLVFLGLEILAVIWAGTVFRLFDSRLLAGFLAGTYFIGFGVFVLWRMLASREFKRLFSFYPLLVHLFVISIPMMVARFLNTEQEFSTIRIWGMEGPQFHRLSTMVFLVLILATVLDLIRYWRRTK